MSDSLELSPLAQFCRAWTDGFATVLTLLKVASPSVTFTEPVSAAALSAAEVEKTISVYFKGGGTLSGEQIWVADLPGALQLAQVLLSEPLNPAAEFSTTYKDAFDELLRQVAGQAASAWKEISSADTEIIFHAATEQIFVPAKSITVKISAEAFPELSLRFFVNAALCDSLHIAPNVSENSASAPPSPASDAVALPQNLALLLDVELEATIRFGEKEMLLRDIFSLMPGAIVELDQMVNEPAELLVAGRRIARGEVVVVDGNFGLRVTEVVSRDQRAEILQR
jgi:flagellar motor switch protein FliN/FliY